MQELTVAIAAAFGDQIKIIATFGQQSTSHSNTLIVQKVLRTTIGMPPHSLMKSRATYVKISSDGGNALPAMLTHPYTTLKLTHYRIRNDRSLAIS